MKSSVKILLFCLLVFTIISSCKKEDPEFVLSLSVNPAESGTVTGGGTYKAGDEVILTANANQGYEFVDWTKDGSEVSTEATFNYTTTAADVTLIANFVQLTYTLSVQVNLDNSGTVTEGGTYPAGQQVNLNATSAIGYTFVNWTIGETEVSNNANFTYTTTTENVTIKANFEEKQIIVTLGAQTNATTGAFYSLGQDLVYNQSDAANHQDTIDILCFYEHDEINNRINDITISSPGANITGIFGGGATDPMSWTTKRLTIYTPTLPTSAIDPVPANTPTITKDEFDQLHQNDPAIQGYFNTSMTSSNKKAKLLAVDDIYAFKTHDNIYGLFKVISVVQGADGSVQVELKLRQ
jgi:uncharacterized repeat protein (TIGR02543 family)